MNLFSLKSSHKVLKKAQEKLNKYIFLNYFSYKRRIKKKNVWKNIIEYGKVF